MTARTAVSKFGLKRRTIERNRETRTGPCLCPPPAFSNNAVSERAERNGNASVPGNEFLKACSSPKERLLISYHISSVLVQNRSPDSALCN